MDIRSHVNWHKDIDKDNTCFSNRPQHGSVCLCKKKKKHQVQKIQLKKKKYQKASKEAHSYL